MFSQSNLFSQSNCFVQSNEFSFSNSFSLSSYFSKSSYFTHSYIFSSSVSFSNSKLFSDSNHFSSSNSLMNLNISLIGKKGNKHNKTTIIGIVSGLLTLALVGTLITVLMILIKKKKKSEGVLETENEQNHPSDQNEKGILTNSQTDKIQNEERDLDFWL